LRMPARMFTESPAEIECTAAELPIEQL